MAAMKEGCELTGQSVVMILTVESVPLIGVQTRGNLGDGEKIVLVHLPLQTGFLQQNVIVSLQFQTGIIETETTLQKHTAYGEVCCM